MQLRVFPGFTVVAVLLLARGVISLLDASAIRRPYRILAYALFALLLPYFMVASLFKATNEPLLSNKWGFYIPAEASTLRWSEAHLQDTAVWTGVDERLWAAAYLILDNPKNTYSRYGSDPDQRYVLLSELELERAKRLGIPLPLVLDWLYIYDSGQAQLYHQRPATPYQK
jgi:hypothetical protein